MKNTFYMTFFLILLCCITGCKKEWLEERSDIRLIVPASLKDCQALLDNSEIMNTGGSSNGEIASDGYSMAEASFNAVSNDERVAYSLHKDWRTIGSDWSQAYGKLYYCNLVLETLAKINPVSEDEKIIWENLKSQALFHRAWTFYGLAQIYAQPYRAATAASDLGICLRLESDLNIFPIRNSVQESFNQIFQDLKSSREHLPSSIQYKTRPSLPAYYGLMARIYLSIEDYGNAGKYADSCLSVYSSMLNYSSDIVATATAPIARLNKEVIFHSLSGVSTSISTRRNVDVDLYNSYASADVRKVAFFTKRTDGSWALKSNYSGSASATNMFVGLAVDEIYLIRAECFARSGVTASAMNDLNKLLRNRWSGTYVDQTVSNAEEALKLVLTERRKELIHRGLRWNDLRRLNRDSRFQLTLSRTVGSKVYTVEPNSFRYTFPIPDLVLEKVSLPQSPGWE